VTHRGTAWTVQPGQKITMNRDSRGCARFRINTHHTHRSEAMRIVFCNFVCFLVVNFDLLWKNGNVVMIAQTRRMGRPTVSVSG
jgi:hypothetical protein